MKYAAVILSALAPLIAAHGAVTSYTIAGRNYSGYTGYSPGTSPPTIEWQWPDYNPTLSVTDIKMRCNGGSSAGLVAMVAAGTNVTANWAQWTHAQGPVMVWMFNCQGPFSACTGEGAGWFKIDQMGMYAPPLSGTSWGTALVEKNLNWTSKIPSNLLPGNYLIRHELLALHQPDTPQFYAECAQLAISGTGTAVVPSSFLYPIPGYAPQSDPGITINVYSDTATTYQPPGGNVWTGFT